jgi:purine-binding chemotaxis protein CheW
MSADEAELLRRVAELRRDFDGAFAAPLFGVKPEQVDLLLLRVTSQLFAVDLADVAALHVRKRITRFPTPIPGLLGVAAFRGSVVSVHDARALLGYPSQRPPDTVVLTKLGFALAFDGFERHLRVERAALARAARAAQTSRLVESVLLTPDGVRPVVDIAALAELLRARLPAARA